MIEKTAKREVKYLLTAAQKTLESALLWPKGMTAEDFHDIKSMIQILKEIHSGREIIHREGGLSD